MVEKKITGRTKGNLSKPRAKKTETTRKVGKMRELAMPYGRGPRYKTPGLCNATREVLLGSASGYVIAVMYNYNPAAVQETAMAFKRKFGTLAAYIPTPKLSVRP